MDPYARANALLERASNLSPRRALPLVEKAYLLVRAHAGARDPNLGPILAARGHYRELLEDWTAAARDYQRAAQLLDIDDPDAAEGQVQALRALGNLRRQQGRYADAAPLLRTALKLSEKRLGRDHLETGLTLNALGILCKYTDRFAEGIRHYRRALAIVEAACGRESIEAATVHHNLGGIHHARGRMGEAEPHGRRAYEIRRMLLGDDHIETTADRAAWAAILDGLGHTGQAERIYVEVIARFRKNRAPYEVAVNLHNLAALRARRGALADAERLYRRALALKVQCLGRRHPDLAITREGLRAVVKRRSPRCLSISRRQDEDQVQRQGRRLRHRQPQPDPRKSGVKAGGLQTINHNHNS